MENLQIIEQAIDLATTKGVYNLKDIDIIINALRDLNKKLLENENNS